MPRKANLEISFSQSSKTVRSSNIIPGHKDNKDKNNPQTDRWSRTNLIIPFPGGSSRCGNRQRIHIHSAKLADCSPRSGLSHHLEVPVPSCRIFLLSTSQEITTDCDLPIYQGQWQKCDSSFTGICPPIFFFYLPVSKFQRFQETG